MRREQPLKLLRDVSDPHVKQRMVFLPLFNGVLVVGKF